MAEVEPPAEAEVLLRGLRRLAAQSADADAAPSESKPTLVSRMPWSDQIIIFGKLYPEGFADPKWTLDCRGEGAKRRLKRHRAPVLLDAERILTEERLGATESPEDQAALIEDIRAMLSGTDLVGARYVEDLGRLGDRSGAYVDSLRETLYGARQFAGRFGQWLDVHKAWLGSKLSWRAATVLPALVFPDEHVCIHKTAFLAQAGELAPAAGYSKTPTLPGYSAMQNLVQEVGARLRGEGLEPRDLMDVRDFIEVTMRPSSAKLLL